MLDEAYELLGASPGDDSSTVEASYWRRAHELAKERANDPDAAEELERVNLAYQQVMDRRRKSGPRSTRVGERPWRRRFAYVGVGLWIALAALPVGLSFREEIEGSTARGVEEAQYGWDETIEWLRSLDEEPTPPPPDELSR